MATGLTGLTDRTFSPGLESLHQRSQFTVQASLENISRSLTQDSLSTLSFPMLSLTPDKECQSLCLAPSAIELSHPKLKTSQWVTALLNWRFVSEYGEP